MNTEECYIILGFAKGLDPSVQADELAVSAWSNVLPGDMTLEQALGYARDHYLESDRTLKPAHLVGRHREARQPEKPKVIVEPDHDCINGFIIIEEDRNGQIVTAAQSCPQCMTRPTSVR